MLRVALMKALCHAGEARESRLMVHSCQNSCPEQRFFFIHRASTLSCSEGVK